MVLDLDLLLMVIMGLNGVEPKLVHKSRSRSNNWVWNWKWWLSLETSQAVTIRRVASTMSSSLALVSVLVSTESLRGIELARTVKAWE
jgi:hypothetical protein